MQRSRHAAGCTVHRIILLFAEPDAVFVQDGEVPDLDVSQVLPDQIPFRDVVSGVDIPGFTDHNPAFGQEGNLDVQVSDALLSCGEGEGEGQQGQQKEEFQVEAHSKGHFYKDSDLQGVMLIIFC